MSATSSAIVDTRRRLGRWLAGGFAGLSAVGAKELRGRMRGRRAFVILTLYLLLLAVFGWMVEQILQRNQPAQFGGFNFASAQIGQQLFIWLLLLETLLVPFLAPALTAPSISLEREKGTIDLLAATPISSLAIVVGKLFSALSYLFLLIAASIPISALVFVFGGVGPDDLVRGYVVLTVTAIGFGSLGLFFSALVGRTQTATILTYVVVLAMTMGSFFVWRFWYEMVRSGTDAITVRDETGAVVLAGQPPEALLYFNPFVAQADVICGTETGYGDWCRTIGEITNQPFVVSGPSVTFPVPVPVVRFGVDLPGVAGGGAEGGVAVANLQAAERSLEIAKAMGDVPVAQDATAFGVTRDSFWPKATVGWIALSIILVALSVQLVSPTRRWRPRLPALRRGPRPRSG